MKKIILSLAFVVGVASLTQFFVSQKLISDTQNREVANFGERNNEYQIQWEQKVAQELSSSGQGLQNASAPNWQDQLVYEFFMGKYDVAVEGGHIKKLSLQNSQEGVHVTADQLVNRFGKHFKDFKNYKIVSENSSGEKIELYDGAGKSVGSFEIRRESNGQITEVSF